MSSFNCEYCGALCSDSPEGYISGCDHYPLCNTVKSVNPSLAATIRDRGIVKKMVGKHRFAEFGGKKKISLRVPVDLFAAITERAEAENRSLTNMIECLLIEALLEKPKRGE